MTGSTGLRRFVTGARPGPPAAGPATAGQDQRQGPPPGTGQLYQRQPDLAGMADLAGTGDLAGTAGPAWPAAAEKCEMCATEVPAEHGHVADLEGSTLACACRACYLLFTQPQAGRGRYRSVPDRYLADPRRPLTVAEWDQLDIPVGLAFFLRSSQRDLVTGFYPSPAGATECILDLGAWDRLAASYPLLAAAEPDVEAALICRTDAGVEYFLVPIDACYELAGRMRLYWRGFDGGSQARESIEAFLAKVRSRARVYRQEAADG